MDTTELIKRVNYLVNKGQTALNNKLQDGYTSYVESGIYVGFRTSGLSFISSLFGESHSYYKEFNDYVNNSQAVSIENGINILLSIKDEIEQGWLTSIKELVTAEVFSDFLEMSKHLLDEKYKDASAVMIGSVLEEHLRQLCLKNSIDITFVKGDDLIPKKANLLNADLTKKGAYGVLEQKNITAWLDLRNRAAHGKYSEYKLEQVDLMYQGVLDFIMRTK
jgi:hypothetical protein